MQIYNADCMDILPKIPDKSIDLIITDPPYNMRKSGGYYRGGGAFGTNKRDYHGELEGKKLTDGITNKVLQEYMRIMKKVNIYIWCNKEQIYQYMDFFKDYNCEVLTWHKTNPTPTCSNKYLSDTEYCLFFRENGVKIYGNYHTKHKYWVTPTNKADKEKYKHPTVKPLEIIKMLVENSSCEGDVVLDSYMGSGTTGVACKSLYRDFVGIEIDKDYYDMAEARLYEYLF